MKKIFLLIFFLLFSVSFVWNAEGSYVSSFDISEQGTQFSGITTDGTNIWITKSYDGNGVGTDKEVYKYDMAGNYTSEHWDVDGQIGGFPGQAGDIATDGTNIWVTDAYGSEVEKYDMDGTHISSFDVSGQGINPYGITTDGTNIWIADTTDPDKVYKYDMAGNYISSFDISAQGTQVRDVTTDGTHLWTCDITTDEVTKYDMAGNYISSFDVGADGIDNPQGLTVNGIYVWVLDFATNKVYKYEFPLATTKRKRSKMMRMMW